MKLWLNPESTVYGLSYLRGDAIDSNASVDPLCAQGLSELYHPSFGCVIGQLLLWVWHYWEGHSTFKTYEEHFYQFSVISTLSNSEIPLSEIVKLTWVYFIYWTIVTVHFFSGLGSRSIDFPYRDFKNIFNKELWFMLSLKIYLSVFGNTFLKVT